MEALPPLEKRDEYLNTRPPTALPPIGEEEFMRLYYQPSLGARCRSILGHMPVKLNGPLRGTRVQAWGLYALDRPAIIKIVISWLLCCAAVAWFPPYWLQYHPDDLVGAFTAPLVLFGFSAVAVVLPTFATPREPAFLRERPHGSNDGT